MTPMTSLERYARDLAIKLNEASRVIAAERKAYLDTAFLWMPKEHQ